MREIVHIQAGQCGNQIGAKVRNYLHWLKSISLVTLKENFHYNFKICYPPHTMPTNLRLFCCKPQTNPIIRLLSSVNFRLLPRIEFTLWRLEIQARTRKWFECYICIAVQKMTICVCSSGRWSRTSMVLIRQAPTTVTQTCSWSASTSTTTRLPV